MAEIIAFRSNEVPKLNYDEIYILLSELGTQQGLRVFERALFEVSDKLCQLEMAVYENDTQAARRIAGNLKSLCLQVGLDSVCDVACQLIEAIDSADLEIIPVICQRMVCLGEASLFQLAELPRVLADQ